MRIGIVNDLPIVVEAIRRRLAPHAQHQVAWVAQDGQEAVEQCAKDTPDLVLMDLFMPRMGGVEATRRIMAASPCAILVVTANVGTSASQVFEAMGHGALDAIDAPRIAPGNAHTGDSGFLAKVDAIDRLLRDRVTVSVQPAQRAPDRVPAVARRLVAIGASAGGPAALQTVLRGLPKDFPAAVVVVQHVDERFAPGMADWLSQHSALPVRLSREGEVPAAGVVLIAGSNDHLVLKGAGRLGYTPEPKDYVYRPSIDVFFESVIRHWPGAVAGVLLTGMGRDGASGLKALRDKGHYTIAQDRASSAVYGMPKAAAELGAAVEILPVHHIAAKLLDEFCGKT